jgi:putative zinc finger protein
MKVVPLRGRICAKTREHLDAYVSNELLIETNQDVLKHLEGCATCSELLQTRLRLKHRLKQTVKSGPVPSGLRDRIRTAIRDEASIRPSPAVWPRWPVAAAAVLLLGLSAVGTLRLWNSRAPASEVSSMSQDLTLSEQVAAVLKVGISDHIHCVVESHSDQDLLTSEQMAQKMGADYEGLIPALKTELPEGFFISVGHRCDANGRQFVHLVLKHDDKVVSVVITEKDGLNFPTSGTRVSNVKADGITLHHDRLQSLEVVGFQAKSHLAFVVSSLEHEENMQIATRLAPTVSGFLDKL